MKLIIAEKPTQAQDYAKALGGFSRKDGYLENNEYYITWCYGHLISLEKDTAYRKEGPWSKDYLPLIPVQYKYTIGKDKTGKTDTGKKKQINSACTNTSNTLLINILLFESFSHILECLMLF